MKQTTIAKHIHCTGVGLHSGKTVTLTMRPAAEDTGIVFHAHTPRGREDISPAPDAVIATGLATTLGKGDAAIATVEHLLAALRGLAVDNVHIDVEGGEIPIMDGSAAQFTRLLGGAGIRVQSRSRRVLRIRRPVRLEHEGKSIKAEPYNGLYIDYSIDFAHPAIGRQRMALEITPYSFGKLGDARTFGFLRDVEMLKERGLALGGSLDNAVVLDDDRVLNSEGLRYSDEFVRHKILDFIGDMAVLPLPLHGRFTVRCSGHALNNGFARHIADAGSLYLETINTDKTSRPGLPKRPECQAPGVLGFPAFAR